jgi:adenylate cyclase class 2
MREYEIRILEVDVKEWISYLESHGAIKKGDWLQQRKVYDFHPVIPNKWLRLRSNGEETTLTIKEIIDKNRIDGTRELEVSVSDFDKTSDILKELGYVSKAFQENRRVRYLYKDVEFDFDTWPLIPTYVEIEGKSVQEVEDILAEFSFDEAKKTCLDVKSLFREFYQIDLDDYPVLAFEGQE